MSARRILYPAICAALTVMITAPALAGRSSGKPGKGAASTDTQPPAIDVPADMQVEAASGDGAVVSYPVSASDDVDRRVSVSCAPASGSAFALGSTAVNCEATDSAGNRAAASFRITVVDTTTPTLGLPGPVSAQSADASGTTVSFQVSATDIADPAPAVSCSRDSGSQFPVGSTTVQCTAEDASGNLSDGSFVVTVAVETNAAATTSPDPAPAPAPQPVPTGSALLSWSVPTTRANGTPLAVSELSGYEIYVLSESTGESTVISVPDPLLTTYTLNGLPGDIYHFAVGAVDTGGLISDLSGIVSKDLR